MGSNSRRLTVLRRRSDFQNLLKFGSRVRPSDWVLMNFALNPDGVMRCGWTLPRHVGTAVTRNRLKRWSRVFFRKLIEAGNVPPVDVNVVFRKAENDFYKKLDYEKFAQALERGWNQIGRRLQESSRPVSRSLQNDRD